MKTDTAERNDIHELTLLNRDYIHSVQHGDVRRFDEILAEDFLCSNPDGLLVDKNQFLAQTARPFREEITAFEGRLSGIGHPKRHAGPTRLQHTQRRTKSGAAERVEDQPVRPVRLSGGEFTAEHDPFAAPFGHLTDV